MSRSVTDDTFYSMASIPPTPRRVLPTAPSPEATEQEVQTFIRDYFLAIHTSWSVDQAEIHAQAIDVNGMGLYVLPSDAFQAAFGPVGRGLHEIILDSKYAYVSTSNIRRYDQLY